MYGTDIVVLGVVGICIFVILFAIISCCFNNETKNERTFHKTSNRKNTYGKRNYGDSVCADNDTHGFPDLNINNNAYNESDCRHKKTDHCSSSSSAHYFENERHHSGYGHHGGSDGHHSSYSHHHDSGDGHHHDTGGGHHSSGGDYGGGGCDSGGGGCDSGGGGCDSGGGGCDCD